MMTDKIDISPEAVERLALDHDIVGNDPIKYVMGHPHHWKTAKTLRALSARIAELEADVDEAQEELIAAQGQIADAQAAEARFIEQRGSLVSVTKKLAKTEARLAEEQAFANEKAKVLVEALGECRDEIDNYIRQEYPHDHPVQERYRKRDFSANPARAALAGMETKP